MCGSKNRLQQKTCLKEIELRATNSLIMLGLPLNIIRGPMWSLEKKESIYSDGD